MADVQYVTVTLSDGTPVQVVAGTPLHDWYLALAARTTTVTSGAPDIDLRTLRPMAWFMTPHGPQSVIEPATLAEFRRRDYAEITAQQAADYFAGAVEIPDVSFITGQELPAALAAAAADDDSPFAVALRAALESRDVAPSALPAAMPNLFRTLRNYNDATAPAVRIIGLGSSVGVGATLPTPATQAPSAYFESALKAAINKLGNLNIVHTNGSVNGTIVTDGNSTHYAAAKTAAGGTPTVVVLAYGMNDGMPAQYHAGQTFPGAYSAMKTMIANVLADGGDPVVLTSPHPHTGRTPWTNAVGGATYAVGTPALTLAASVKSADWAGTGVNVPASYRHKRVNDALRFAAYEAGVPVIDAERYWFKALATYGEDALFDTGEFAHPNLLGHQQSYWRAIDAFVAGLARAAATSGVQASSGDVVKVKGNNQSSTSTTRVTDDELRFSAPPNSVWEVDVMLGFTVPTAQDMRVSWETPTGATGRFDGIGPANTATAVNGSEVVARSGLIGGNMPFGGNTADATARLKAIVHVGSTGGQIGIQHGLDVTGGTLTVYADSLLRARRIS